MRRHKPPHLAPTPKSLVWSYTRAKRRTLHARCGGKKVLVFGTFDGLHARHGFFLREARKQGDYLIAVLAQDETVVELKGRPPRVPLAGRLAALRASGLADKVCAGDTVLGSWSAVKKYKPDIIALGYDQDALRDALAEFIKRENLPVTLIRLPALRRRLRRGEPAHPV